MSESKCEMARLRYCRKSSMGYCNVEDRDLEICPYLKAIGEIARLVVENGKHESMQEKLKEWIDDYKQYVGRCFTSKNFRENEQNQIKAFKVLEILESPNERYARCVALIDGYESNCWNVKAIKNQVIGLWTHNKLRLMNSESNPKVIDFYKEISQEEFEKLYREYQGDLDDKAYS